MQTFSNLKLEKYIIYTFAFHGHSVGGIFEILLTGPASYNDQKSKKAYMATSCMASKFGILF